MIYLIFFLSGVSALIYQVAWMKILTVEFGTTVYAVSTVLSVFMSGLALGSFLFGRRVDKTNNPLLLYASMEGALGAYALLFLLCIPLVHKIYIAIERTFEPSFESFSLIKFAFTFVLLLIPTTLMGGTLPVLSKYLGMESRARARRLAMLYSFNTLGAVCGTLGFAFVWILLLGVNGSIYLSVAINFLLVVGSLWLHRRRGAFAHQISEPIDTPEKKPELRQDAAPSRPRQRALAIAVAFTSGFVILACEVLWTRLFVNFLSGNALIFATILTAVLTGLAIGGFVASYLVERLKAIATLLGSGLLAGAAFLVVLVVGQYWFAERLSIAVQSQVPAMPFVVLFLILFVPCVVFGVTFPTLIKWVTGDAATVGSDIGRLYAVNTFGGVLGSLISGFVMIRVLGLNGSLLALAILYCGTSIFLFTSRSVRVASAAAILAVGAMLLAPSLTTPTYWYNGGFKEVKSIPPENTEFLEEGVSATVGVARFGDQRYLTVNGIIVAQGLPHDLWDLLSKAHLPMLLHPNPRDVALIGLGAGVSLGATEKYDLDRLDCIEISPEVIPASNFFKQFNQNCLEDPRLNLVLNDGRHYLLTTPNRYDVINVDPIDPPVCTLYSQDFFQLCHDRLRDGGLMVQWLPLFRLSPGNIKVVMQGFTNVFENTTVWYNGTAAILIGSRGGPMKIDLDSFVSRAADPRVKKNLAIIHNPDPWMLLTMFVGDGKAFQSAFPEEIPENSDNRPYLEYTVLRTRESANELWALEMLTKMATPLEAHLDQAGLVPEFHTDFARMRAITNIFFQARLLMFRGQQDQAEVLVSRAIADLKITQNEIVWLRHFFRL